MLPGPQLPVLSAMLPAEGGILAAPPFLSFASHEPVGSGSLACVCECVRANKPGVPWELTGKITTSFQSGGATYRSWVGQPSCTPPGMGRGGDVCQTLSDYPSFTWIDQEPPRRPLRASMGGSSLR